MTSNAHMGAERPQSSPEAAPQSSKTPNTNASHDLRHDEANQLGDHSPEAKQLLRRYLSEIHSYRQLGNAALSELEKRLIALSDAEASNTPKEMPKTEKAPSSSPPASSPRDVPSQEKSPNLTDRLKELSAYLHADLIKQRNTTADSSPSASAQPRRVKNPRNDAKANTEHPAKSESETRQNTEFKLTPNAPVLDRAWFEDRFANMRASINQLAEQIPTRRLEVLENQFHQLMEKLEAKETDRPMAAVEAGLKKLAAYLDDNRQWSRKQDARVQGIEERLDHLSGLVAQSNAALSATAKGLEIVARGTGSQLANAAADLVCEKLEPKIRDLDQKSAIKELNSEVGKLSEQSKRFTRATDERLKQLQHSLDESLYRLEDGDRADNVSHAEESWPERIEKYHTNEKYQGTSLAAARRAARLAQDKTRSVPQQTEPLRYQIPYGEFLPEEERANSRIGLVVAAIILLLASAAMLYLNLREKSHGAALSSAALTSPGPDDTSALPPAPMSQSLAASAKTGGAGTGLNSRQQSAPQKPWTVNVKSQITAARGSDSNTTPGAHAAAADGKNDLAEETKGKDRLALNATASRDSLRKAAVAGDVEAQFSIGETYLKGRDNDKSLPAIERLSKAARWFRRAAEKGHAPSQYRLATLYELGKGAPKNRSKAMKWYELAAKSGHVKAMHNLAVLSINGSARSANYPKAAEWFTKAAEHGLADSQYNLAILYERGLGIEKNPATAYRWFALAAATGDKKALLKRDELAAQLTGDKLAQEKRKLLAWSAQATDWTVNSIAPEPPVEKPRRAAAAVEPRLPNTQLMKTAWNAQITRLDSIVAEAQRLLKQLGYKPGPIDGIAGPRTMAAIRAFEQKKGLPGTGKVTDGLIVKMASALSS